MLDGGVYVYSVGIDDSLMFSEKLLSNGSISDLGVSIAMTDKVLAIGGREPLGAL